MCTNMDKQPTQICVKPIMQSLCNVFEFPRFSTYKISITPLFDICLPEVLPFGITNITKNLEIVIWVEKIVLLLLIEMPLSKRKLFAS